jgi:hypothetical protein
MADSNTKKQVLEALAIAQSLEKLPSGNIIGILKNKLDATKFVDGITYISEFVLKSILSVCPEEVVEQIDNFNINGQTEELSNLLSVLIAAKKEVAQAADNGLNFAGRVVARLNSVSLQN